MINRYVRFEMNQELLGRRHGGKATSKDGKDGKEGKDDISACPDIGEWS